jgi:hypothetical protein
MTPARWCARRLVLLVLAGATSQAQELAPAYSRDGFDYFSAPVEAATARTKPTACEKRYGPSVEVREAPEVQKGQPRWLCDVMTASEPRLSAKLNDEIALIEVPDPRRQKLVDALIEKFKLLAQCPAGTTAVHDGSMYLCRRRYGASELCAAGSVVNLDSEPASCVTSTCEPGLIDLGALTGGKHPGCFKCPRGTFDAKETEAFHGALKGMPADFTEVFCRAPAAPKKK